MKGITVPGWARSTALGTLIWSTLSGLTATGMGGLDDVAAEPADGEPMHEGDSTGAGRRTGKPADPQTSGVAADERHGVTRSFFDQPLYILVVDDDPNLRALLRTSFEVADIQVDEADTAASAAQKIASRHPDVVVLDIGMPGVNGLDFCRALKGDPYTRNISVVLLTGDSVSERSGRESGADAFLRKPFSPLALLAIVERLGAREHHGPPPAAETGDAKQLILYAQDFRRLLELERGQRALLQEAYRETVVALARALETKDGATGAHSERVRRYATELAKAVDASLLDEPSLEYGFILHDIGKIGIPDSLLGKVEPLTDADRRMLEMHTVLGEQMVGDAALLRGQGARVVRSHHERWDGRGYPDRLAGEEIPLGARLFSVADTLDAMTSDRPYRKAGPWEGAVAEIVDQAGWQFDPHVVDAFRDREEALRRVYYEFNTN
jgi:response regulator RpfG family c-di-GMP phosphodiesterase